jgi:hypothetical protein
MICMHEILAMANTSADAPSLGCEELPAEVSIPHGINLDYFNTTYYYVKYFVQPGRRKSLAMS